MIILIHFFREENLKIKVVHGSLEPVVGGPTNCWKSPPTHKLLYINMWVQEECPGFPLWGGAPHEP
jgi:hypothetical protein